MTPFDDFSYLVNHVLLGEEPTIEDFILLIGTLVAFIAFVLWCCFPVHPKDTNNTTSVTGIGHSAGAAAASGSNTMMCCVTDGGVSEGDRQLLQQQPSMSPYSGSATNFVRHAGDDHSYHDCT